MWKGIVRTVVIAVSVGMILWYLLSAIMTIGSVCGIIFFGFTGLAAVFWNQLSAFCRKQKEVKWKRIVLRVLKGLFLTGVVYVLVLLGLMCVFSLRTPSADATMVVLGCQVNGEVPSLMLSRRIDAAYQYLQDHPDTKCILSGGMGNHENISEAECMYRELTKRGIDPQRLYREDRSTNTEENIRFSGEIIREQGLSSELAIVTDGFHEMRAAVIAGKQGYSCGAVSAETPLYLAANFTTREILALSAELLRF